MDTHISDPDGSQKKVKSDTSQVRTTYWIARILAWKWILFSLALAFVVAMSFGVTRLGFTGNYRIWLDPNDSTLAAFDSIESIYAKSDNVFFVIEPTSGSVFNTQSLAAIKWITQAAWQLPMSTRVDSVTNFQFTDAGADELIVRDLVPDPAKLNSQNMRELQDYALKEPSVVNKLVSASGHVAAVNITFHMPGKNRGENGTIARAARALKVKFQAQYPEHNIYLTGWIMRSQIFPELAMGDMKKLIPYMYLVLLLALGLILRSLSSVVATMIILTGAILGGMGFAGWMGFKITTLSAVAPTIIMVLSVANCVHILLYYLAESKLGLAKQVAIRNSMVHNFWPIILTTLSTAIGFICYNFNESPPFQQYGNIVAVGLFIALISALFILPILLLILPKPKVKLIDKTKETSRGVFVGNKITSNIARLNIQYPKQVLVGVSLFGMMLGGLMFKNQFNENYVKYISPTVDFRRDTDFAAENISGVYDIQYSLETNLENGINTPEYFALLHEFTTWFRLQNNVMSVTALSDTIQRINENMNNGDSKYYRIPNDRNKLAQYMLLYGLSLPLGMDLSTLVNENQSATRVVVRLENIDFNRIMALDLAAQAWLQQNSKDILSNAPAGASITLVFCKMATRMIDAMFKSSAAALLLISLMMLLIFKSFRLSLMSLIPNIFPLVMSLGVWAIYHGMINLALTTVIGVTLGIVVDDTIHFLYHYHKNRKTRGLLPAEALRQTFDHVGMAMITTSLVLVAGFSVLLLSPFGVNFITAIFTIWTVGFALLTDFFMLPPILILFDRWLYPNLQKAPVSSGSLTILQPKSIQTVYGMSQRMGAFRRQANSMGAHGFRYSQVSPPLRSRLFKLEINRYWIISLIVLGASVLALINSDISV